MIPKPHGHPQSLGLDAKRSHSPQNLPSGLYLRCDVEWESEKRGNYLKRAETRRRQGMGAVIGTGASGNECVGGSEESVNRPGQTGHQRARLAPSLLL